MPPSGVRGGSPAKGDRMTSKPSLDTALSLFSAGRADQAEQICRNLLARPPASLDALNLLAVLLCRRGALAEAEPLLFQALALRPNSLQTLETLGDLHFQRENFHGAANWFAQAAALRPQTTRFQVKLAQALSRADRLAEAVEAYRQALALDPARLDLRFELGIALSGLEASEEAVAVFRETTRLAPDSARAWRLLADQLGALDRREEAVAAYRTTLALAPDDTDAVFNLVRLFRDLGQIGEARLQLEQTLTRHPDTVPILTALAAVRVAEGDNAGAVAVATRALSHEPDNPEALVTLGIALLGLNRPTEAEPAFRHALAVKPDSVPALTNLGVTLWGQGASLAEASSLIEQALALTPDNAGSWTNLALIQLQAGDFDQGWRNFRWRLGTFGPGWDRRYADLPRWDGGPLDHGRLLISSEQGIGDQVMFAGFLPQLAARGLALAVEADPRLKPLFRRSFPDIHFVPMGRAEALPGDLAAHLPCGDLPEVLRPDRGPVPWLAESYLRPDPALRDRLRHQYGTDLLRVGLAWRSAQVRTGARRSLAPALLTPLLAVPGVRWISLQYGDTGPDGTSEAGPGVWCDRAIDQVADPDAFAAQIAALDWVVTIDNSTAHFAGALGVPTLLLNPFRPDWRWFLEGEDSVWYRSLTVLRQPAPDAWAPVVARAADLIARSSQP